MIFKKIILYILSFHISNYQRFIIKFLFLFKPEDLNKLNKDFGFKLFYLINYKVIQLFKEFNKSERR